MLYQHITDHCADERIATACAKLAPACEALAKRRNLAAAPLLNIPARSDDLAGIETLARNLAARFSNVVVAGTGGSGLSGRTLTCLAPYSEGPAFHFLENIDPDMMDGLLAHLNVDNSCFLIISKSGATAETLGQFYVLLEHVLARTGHEEMRERFIVITQPGDNPLRRSAQEYGLRIFDHEDAVGGRFSILTNVGLLPAAIAGLDIRALRRGAQSVISQLDSAGNPADFPPALGAALQVAHIEKGYPLSVMLPYAERLSGFSAWYRQIWAESLGKQGRGSTPIRAVGTTDQHSQLQLYLDGPKDKLFHMILLDRTGQGKHINAPAHPDLDYLRGRTLGDVMHAEQEATLKTLVRAGCPVRVFRLHKLAEEEMGALLMHFMLEVILTAALLDVDPFGQPAVEEGKSLAREYLLKSK